MEDLCPQKFALNSVNSRASQLLKAKPAMWEISTSVHWAQWIQRRYILLHHFKVKGREDTQQPDDAPPSHCNLSPSATQTDWVVLAHTPSESIEKDHMSRLRKNPDVTLVWQLKEQDWGGPRQTLRQHKCPFYSTILFIQRNAEYSLVWETLCVIHFNLLNIQHALIYLQYNTNIVWYSPIN